MEGQTVLVPLDGSIASQAALPYATALARAKSASLRLLRVINRKDTDFLFAIEDQTRDALDRLRETTRVELDQHASALRRLGFEVSTVVVGGNPAEEILRDADAAHAAAIVMATSGRGGVERWALGSVADKVMRMARVPTLLMRPPESGDVEKAVRLHTILLPLDGSPLAEAAIKPAAELARATGAEVLVLRIEPLMTERVALSGGLYVPELGRMEEEIGAIAKAYVRHISTRLGNGVRYRAFVERGYSAGPLQSFIDQHHVDLVVMSTHGRGGLARLVIGSTADRLVRSGVPCLLIHPPALPEQQREPAAEAEAR